MNWLSPSLDEGDWVRATELIPVTMTDRLTGSGIPRGTLGVVTSRSGSRVEVEFDAGFGTYRTSVRPAQVRLHSRGRGVGSFRQRSKHLTTIRAGAAIALLAPILWYVIQYLWYYRTADGLLAGFATGIVESTLDLLVMAITNPVATLIYLAAGWLVQRLAFGRSR